MSEARVRLLLELGGTLQADRLAPLLEGVEREGSITRAAAGIGVSYRFAWGLLKAAEARLGARLLERRAGGAGGGGATLTAAARDLLVRYRQFASGVAPLVAEFASGRADGAPGVPDGGAPARPVLLATTIGPVETGLLPALITAFLAEAGVTVRTVAAGTGQALAIAREGRVDLVLAHAPALEQEFIVAGYGSGRHPLMANDFLLVGPAADPAGAGRAPGLAAALRAVAAGPIPFVTRGDRSGTHLKELELWAMAGVKPAGPWYTACPDGALGTAAALRCAAGLPGGAYTLADQASVRVAAVPGLIPLVRGDPALANEFALIPVSAARFPAVNAAGAQQFTAWATGPAGQRIIADYGRDRWGDALFRPATPPGG